MPYKNESSEFLKQHIPARAYAYLGAFLLVAAALVTFMASNASALPGTRTISFFSPHTKQNLTVTYKRYGQFIPAAMRKINYMLRDWRTDQVVRMDPKLIDLLWEIHADLGSRKPISVLSGYRSPKTNAMLRGRSRSVSRYSRHMFGMATDVRFPDISIEKLRNSAMLKQRGGVGYYRGSFVHVDVGNVRHWPRMSRRQLAKLFPNGRSLHVPRGVARPKGRVPPRPLPRSVVVASAPAGVVRGTPPNRIKTPTLVRFAAKRPVQPKTHSVVRLASSVPVPRTKPAAPVFNGPVPLPRANPNLQIRLAANRPAKLPEIVVASAATFSSQPSINPKREVAIARSIDNPVEVITARPVQTAKPKRGLFGLANLAPRFSFGFDTGVTRVASAIKANKGPLSASGLMNVNRNLKGDRLVSQAALEKIGQPVKVASRLGTTESATIIKDNPFRPDKPIKKKPGPYGLLSALFPMFSNGSQSSRRQ